MLHISWFHIITYKKLYLDSEGGSLLADVMAKADQIPTNGDENRTWESESETSYETSVTGTYGLEMLFDQDSKETSESEHHKIDEN